MTKVSRDQLKQWFVTGLYPKQSQFWDWMDSFLHNDDKININAVDGLAEELNGRYTCAEGQALEGQVSNLGEEVDLVSRRLDSTDRNIDILEEDMRAGDVDTLESAKKYTDDREAKILSAVDDKDAATLSRSKEYTDNRDATIFEAVVVKDSEVLSVAKEYTDNRKTEILSSVDIKDTATLRNAIEYTDSREEVILTAVDIKDENALRTTKEYADTIVAALIDSSPAMLDTLVELAAALGNDPNFSTTVMNLIGSKVDKEIGKGLSANDFTDVLREKLAGITEGSIPGPKGDTGSSGVLVSDVAPSDPQVNVWLKPGGEAPEFVTKEDLKQALLPYSEDQYSYGIEWDITVPSPLCTRIGNMSLHRTLPIQSAMRGCLLSDDGTVIEYLAPANWKAHTRDGSNGQVMVELPSHYRKFTTEGNKRSARISEYPLPGYHAVPKKYVSAYEAALDRTANKLCSIVNMAAQFRGGANQTDWDGTYRSLLGRPVASISRTAFRNAARARGAGSQWNCCDYNSYKDVAWLFYIEYANLNCQAAFNAAKDANGYAQGGLGNGVTTLPSAQWAEYNGYSPFVPCGHSDDLGNASGEVAYVIPNTGESTLATVYVPRYRGIENPFGHLWKFTDGINIEVKTDADGGTSKVYVADNPASYNDSNYNGYTMRGLEARTEGYVKEMIVGTYGEIMPALAGGGTTVYWCDTHYTYIGASFLRGVLFGGDALNSAAAGFGCAHSAYAPSATYANAGSRLCFIPAN